MARYFQSSRLASGAPHRSRCSPGPSPRAAERGWQIIPLDRGDIGLRLDRVLLRHLSHLPGVTRNRLQRLIALGLVHVDGAAATRSAARLAATATLTIQLPERRPRTPPAAESIPVAIVYEDEDLLVVDKPAGQVSHPAFRNTSGTLLNALLAHAAGAWTPALVSRLDKDTSGLVLVAKSPRVQRSLQHAGAQNGLEKDYLAVVSGKPPARGTIDLALDRDPWDRRRVTVRDRGGMPSVTRFERLACSSRAHGDISLLKCRLITGRTHQIRVHLASKGWPILGDRTYGPRTAPGRESLPPVARQALHAWRLGFNHPRSRVRLDLTAPLPADLQTLLAESGLSDYSTRARSSRTVASAE